MVDKKLLTEKEIRARYITPAIAAAGWDLENQAREELTFTAGRVIVRGRLSTRGEQRRADYVLYYKPNLLIALVEAKDNTHSVGAGMQQTPRADPASRSTTLLLLIRLSSTRRISTSRSRLSRFLSPTLAWLRSSLRVMAFASTSLSRLQLQSVPAR